MDKRTWCPTLRVEMSDQVAVTRLAELLGGAIYPRRKPRQDHHKPTWTWQVRGQAVRAVAEALLPFAITKREELKVVVGLLENTGQRESAVADSQQESRQEKAYWRLRELKLGRPEATQSA